MILTAIVRRRIQVVALALTLATGALVVGSTWWHDDGGAGRHSEVDGRVDGGVGTTYVSPDGSDVGPGTAAAPYRTLGHALSTVGPGDTLVVGGGTYREEVDIRVAPGRPEAPVTVRAADGERVVVEGLLWLREPSYWDITGLNVTWGAGEPDQHMVKLTGGRGWRFADAEVWGARSFAAILVAGAPEDFTLSGLYVHDTHPSNDVNQDHLIYVNAGGGGGLIERNVLAESPNGRAIKIGGADADDPPVGNLTIRFNTMYRNDGPTNVQLSYHAFDILIERNILVGSSSGRANVTGHRLEGTDITVRDNVGWGSVAVLDPDEPSLMDGGGNLELDPELVDAASGDFRPANPEASAYGRYAGQ